MSCLTLLLMRFQGASYSGNKSHAEDVTCSQDTRKNPVEATEHLLQLNIAHQSVGISWQGFLERLNYAV